MSSSKHNEGNKSEWFRSHKVELHTIISFILHPSFSYIWPLFFTLSSDFNPFLRVRTLLLKTGTCRLLCRA